MALIVGHRHNHLEPSLRVGCKIVIRCQSERRNIGALRYLSENKLDVATSWNTHELAHYSTLLNVIGWISTSLLLPFVSSPTSSSSSSSPSRFFSLKDSEHGNGYDPMLNRESWFCKNQITKNTTRQEESPEKNRHRTRKNNTQKTHSKPAFSSVSFCVKLYISVLLDS